MIGQDDLEEADALISMCGDLSEKVPQWFGENGFRPISVQKMHAVMLEFSKSSFQKVKKQELGVNAAQAILKVLNVMDAASDDLALAIQHFISQNQQQAPADVLQDKV